MLLSSKQQSYLRAVCEAPIDSFTPLGTRIASTPHGPAIWIDNGGDTLAVGHLDHVLSHTPTFQGDQIHCGQLDDRLGVWGVLDYLPTRTNVKYDILLCDSEERGESTAQYVGYNDNSPLILPRRYNWIWELDRAGDDVVTYQYDDPAWEGMLEEGGFRLGWGTFSDISMLEHLGVCAVNVGIGYHHQHTAKCYGELSETLSQCELMVAFLEQHHATRFAHTPRPAHTPGGRWDDVYDAWRDDAGSFGTYPCPACGVALDWRPEWNFCPMCGDDLA